MIAIDANQKKFELASQSGDPVTQELGLTDELAADYAFEVIGRPDTAVQPYHSIRTGGTTVVVDVAKPDNMLTISTVSLLKKNLRGLNLRLGQM